jgi:hypothetical protein
MAGGPNDSSLTRVQPVFNQLARLDPTGRRRLGPLLALGKCFEVVGLRAPPPCEPRPAWLPFRA